MSLQICFHWRHHLGKEHPRNVKAKVDKDNEEHEDEVDEEVVDDEDNDDEDETDDDEN